MPLNPYLTFDGTCEAALTFYADVFGSTVENLMRFNDMPDADPMPDDIGNRLAHARVVIGDGVLMASDTMGAPHEGFHGFTLQTECATTAEGQALFAMLAEGGEITMPFGPTFWAAGFGMCRDRFGVPWMVNVESQSDQT